MRKKPSFETSKKQRLLKAKQELQKEEQTNADRTVQTTLVVEASLLFSVKEIALKRKQAGTKPDTVTGIIRQALKEIVGKEK